MQYFIFFIAGVAGALVKDIINDGYIQLPYLTGGKFYLGFLGSALIGGCVGLLIDGSYMIAFLSGYVGYSIIENVLLKKGSIVSPDFLKKTNGQSVRNNNSSGSWDYI